jgi:DNA-3-methyladenine glycosylase II
MAALGREDVFPSDDLIVQKAIAGIYNLDRADKKQFLKLMESISEKWSPYRSYASLHLWRWKPEEGQ